MKIPTPENRKRVAFSLFITLVSVILITLFMVSLLQSVSNETNSSRLYTTSMDLNRMADSAVNIIQAQITSATSQSESGRNRDAIAWASQPGMIRTYDAGGRPHKVFKLYSWDKMVEPGQAFNSMDPAQLPDQNWSDLPALYTDLNEPANDVYPIFDPKAVDEGVEGFELRPDRALFSMAEDEAPMPVKWLYLLQDGSLSTPDEASSDESVAALPEASAENPIVGRVAFWTDDETAKVNINTASHGTFWAIPHASNPQEQWPGEENAHYTDGFSVRLPVYDEYQRIPGHPATTSLRPILGQIMPVPNYAETVLSYDTDFTSYYELTPRIAGGGSKGGTVFIGLEEEKNLELDADRLYASAGELLFPPDRERSGSVHNNFSASQISEFRSFLTTNSRSPEENLFNKPRVAIWPLQKETQTGVRNAKDKLIAFVSELGASNPGGSDPNPHRYYFQRSSAFTFNDTETLSNGLSSAMSQTEDLVNVPRNEELLNYLHSMLNEDVPGYGASFFDKWGEEDTQQMLTQTFDYIRSTVNTVSLGLDPKYSYTTYPPEDIGWNNHQEIGKSFVMPIRRQIQGSGTTYQGFGRTFAIQEVALVFFAADWKDTQELGTKKVSRIDFNTGIVDGQNGQGVNHLAEPIFVKHDFPDVIPGATITERVDYLKTDALVGDPDGVPDDVGENLASIVDEVGDRLPIPHYDGIGDPQTTRIGAFLLLDTEVLNPGPPSVFQSLRYKVSGLDQLSVNVENVGPYSIAGPSSDEAVMLVRGSEYVSQGNQGYYDFLVTEYPKWGFRQFGRSGNNNTNNLWRNHEETRYYPWVSDEFPPNVLSPPADPVRWKLNQRGQYIDMRSDSALPQKMTLSEANITVEIYPGLMDNDWDDPNLLIQTYNFRFPRQKMPVPQIYRATPLLKSAGGAYTAKPGSDSTGSKHGGGPAFFEKTKETQNDDSDLGFRIRDEEFRPVASYGGGGDLGNIRRDVENQLYAHVNFPGRDLVEWPDGTTEEEKHQEARWYPDFYTGYLRNAIADDADDRVTSEGFLDPRVWTGRAFTGYGGGDYNDSPRDLLTPDSPTEARSSMPGGGMKASDSHIYIRRGDVVRSLVVGASSSSPAGGDLRLIAALPEVDADYYEPHPRYTDQDAYMAHSITFRGYFNPAGYGTMGFHPEDAKDDKNPHEWRNLGAMPGFWKTDQDIWEALQGSLVDGLNYGKKNRPNVPFGMTAATMKSDDPGDFDTGLANSKDGAYLNKPDEAYGVSQRWRSIYYPTNVIGPYGREDVDVVTSFSPNRQIASPVMFGSLPVGIHRKLPWQTLLFNAYPAAGDQHPGFGRGVGLGRKSRAPFDKIPDHVYLDFYTMPVSEPFPISERFSTAGKVNLNYAMMPFPHISRSTGIHAVLQNAKVMAIPDEAAENDSNEGYKNMANQSSNEDASAFRWDVNATETLKGFEERFYGSQPDIFRSASEITTLPIVPEDPEKAGEDDGFRFENPSNVYSVNGTPTYEQMDVDSWWSDFKVTGDNARESVYNQIYPRVTTKSNTYRVHYRVQTLQKRRAGLQTEWVEGADRILGELRGSALIERYLDPNAANIPDYATKDDPVPLHSFYRWRVISEQQFRP